MRLSPEQVERFDRDGYLMFPDVVSVAELAVLRSELQRIKGLDADPVTREKNGEPRSVWGFHEKHLATASSAFRALAHAPRLIEPMKQVLRDDDLYIYQSKANIKTAIDGQVWQWHQDYANWSKGDALPTPNVVSFLVMLEEATEFSGCLYFIPGTHRLGLQDPVLDNVTTSWPLWSVPKERVRELLRDFPAAVPITGKPGTGVIFHSNLVHGSGHNLSATDRWHVYFVYNPIANKPQTDKPRAEWFSSRDFGRLVAGPDDAILRETANV